MPRITGETVARWVNECNDEAVKSRSHINVYIVDSYSAERGFAHQDGHGRRNSNRPYVLLDWERVISGYQSPLEHEMGHAFGLGHVCEPGATVKTSTNIMASADCKRVVVVCAILDLQLTRQTPFESMQN